LQVAAEMRPEAPEAAHTMNSAENSGEQLLPSEQYLGCCQPGQRTSRPLGGRLLLGFCQNPFGELQRPPTNGRKSAKRSASHQCNHHWNGCGMNHTQQHGHS
jgi:hypothetical protein